MNVRPKASGSDVRSAAPEKHYTEESTARKVLRANEPLDTDPPRPASDAAYTREEQMAAVAALGNAATELLNEYFLGSVQRVRTTNCGDPNCGYASCRLADAIIAYEKVADVEP